MADSTQLQFGSKVGFGRYTLLKTLGRGGMGEVWLALDERLQERVALKFLPREAQHDLAALEALRTETVRSQGLTHANIVRIHDLHEEPGGLAFIAMEYVEGPTLQTLRLQAPDRVLRWEFLEPLMNQLCGALEDAHSQKLIHRDLKPANLMVDGRACLKLADFGVAAVLSESVSRLSQQHAASGTLLYMSPQQLTGKRPQTSDDMYALGATFYELLTSKPPFYIGDITHQVLHEAPEPLAFRLAGLGIHNEVPAHVSALIMACLAKEPGERPESAPAVAGWITRVARDSASSRAPRRAVPEANAYGIRSAKRGLFARTSLALAFAFVLLIGAVRFLPALFRSPKNATVERVEASFNAPSSPASVRVRAQKAPPPVLSAHHDFQAWPVFMHARLGTNQLGGYAFCARQNGQIVTLGTNGYARMPWERDSPGVRWSADKRMFVGNVSMLITSVALLKLQEETHHSFSMDDPFWPYVKALFPDVHATVREITIRQLLNQSSGLSGEFNDPIRAAEALRQGASRAGHSSAGSFYLARLVLEGISGQNYTSYVRVHVLSPVGILGMDTRPEPNRPILAYKAQPKPEFGAPFEWDNSRSAGATGWYSSVLDLTAFLEALRKERILSQPFLAELANGGFGRFSLKLGDRPVGFAQTGTWWVNGNLEKGGVKWTQTGTVKPAIASFVDGVDAALLINSDQGDPAALLLAAWEL